MDPYRILGVSRDASEEDIKKIENRKKDKRDEKVDDCLKLSAIYGYIVYRAVTSGNLDEETSDEIIELFKDIVYKEGKTVIMVTHNKDIAMQSDEIYTVKNKKLLKVKK